MPKAEVQTYVEGALYLPFQVGIGIAYYAQRGRGSAVYRHYAVGHDRLLRDISVDTTQVTRHSVAHTELHLAALRSEEHTSELQSRQYLVCRLLLEKKKNYQKMTS